MCLLQSATASDMCADNHTLHSFGGNRAVLWCVVLHVNS